MITKYNLKACPFCGFAARMQKVRAGWDNDTTYFKAVCTGCGANMDRWHKYADEAERFWNHRVEA